MRGISRARDSQCRGSCAWRPPQLRRSFRSTDDRHDGKVCSEVAKHDLSHRKAMFLLEVAETCDRGFLVIKEKSAASIGRKVPERVPFEPSKVQVGLAWKTSASARLRRSAATGAFPRVIASQFEKPVGSDLRRLAKSFQEPEDFSDGDSPPSPGATVAIPTFKAEALEA
jgi:hypothetical protein